jgi:hypothetical protein
LEDEAEEEEEEEEEEPRLSYRKSSNSSLTPFKRLP